MQCDRERGHHPSIHASIPMQVSPRHADIARAASAGGGWRERTALAGSLIVCLCLPPVRSPSVLLFRLRPFPPPLLLLPPLPCPPLRMSLPLLSRP